MDSILVVDDSSTVKKAVASMIGSRYVLSFANDGIDALQQLAAKAFDLVLADIEMPGLGGLHLCAAMRLGNSIKMPPVIIASSHDGDIDRAVAIRAGAIALVAKPFSPSALLGAIESALMAGQRLGSSPNPSLAPAPLSAAPLAKTSL